MIGLGHYLTVAAILFVTGVFGIFVNRKNVIIILMSIELMLLAVNINLVAFSAHLGDLVGQVFALFVLTVAAAEAAIGLAILVCFFRNTGHDRGRGHQRDEGLRAMVGDHPVRAARRRHPLRLRLQVARREGGDLDGDRAAVPRLRAVAGSCS